MALINCPECNHRISDRAAVCPGCGYPMTDGRDLAVAGTSGDTVRSSEPAVGSVPNVDEVIAAEPVVAQPGGLSAEAADMRSVEAGTPGPLDLERMATSGISYYCITCGWGVYEHERAAHETHELKAIARTDHRRPRSWWRLILAGLILVFAIAVVAQIATGGADTDEQRAYDAGVEAVESDLAEMCAMLRDDKREMDAMLSQGDAAGAEALAANTVGSLNRVAAIHATDLGHSSHTEFFISGLWDTLTRGCPDSFYDPQIIGRPN